MLTVSQLVSSVNRLHLWLRDPDLEQDALLRAWERRAQYDERDGVPPHAWIMRLAKNIRVDRARKASREVVAIPSGEVDSPEPPIPASQEDRVLLGEVVRMLGAGPAVDAALNPKSRFCPREVHRSRQAIRWAAG